MTGDTTVDCSGAGNGDDTRPAGGRGLDPGRSIGGYRIVRLIAQGGMGEVYEARQERPRRTVALKIMKPGIASPETLRRFEREADSLAKLRHPSIAQIYEAGTHDDGRGAVPFFVMEFVPGARAITAYAAEKRLDVRARLALFASVCDGVHHGHRNGIIHRDLKPPNILIDSAGQPKIIDFGVARAIDHSMTTLQTSVGELVGTVQYMSPEQCDADPRAIDARTDVSSRGVIRYELRCGRPPYDEAHTSLPEAIRRIRDEDPPRPSTVNKVLRGDVETITLTALSKDPDRRYRSAAELAADIQRFLDDKPIEARPPSLRYQVRVFARRNRAAFTALVATFVILVAASIVSLVFAVRASTDRGRAVTARSTALAEAVGAGNARAFVQQVLHSVDLSQKENRPVTVRGLLDESAARLNTTASDADPGQRASLDEMLGTVYQSLGFLDGAKPYFQEAVRIESARASGQRPALLAAQLRLAAVLRGLREYNAAENAYGEALATCRTLRGGLDGEAVPILEATARMLLEDHRPDEAKAYVQRAIELMSEDHPRRSDCLTTLATVHRDLGEEGDAERLFGQALRVREDSFGPRDPLTISALNNLAGYLLTVGQTGAAESAYRDGWTRAAGRLTENDWMLHGLAAGLAACLVQRGSLDEAAALLPPAVRRLELLLGPNDPRTVRAACTALALAEARGNTDEAAAWRERCREK